MPPPEITNANTVLEFEWSEYIFDCDCEKHGIKGWSIVSIDRDARYAVMRFNRGSFEHDVFCNLIDNKISLFEAFGESPGTENGAKAPTLDSVTARFSPTCLSDRQVPVSYLRDNISGQVAHIITALEEHPDSYYPRPTWNPATCSAWRGNVYEMLLYDGVTYETPRGEFTFFRGVFNTVVKKGENPGEWIFPKIQWTDIPINIQIDGMSFGWLGKQALTTNLIAVKYYKDGEYHDGEMNLETMVIRPALILEKPDWGYEVLSYLTSVEKRTPTGWTEGDV